MAMMDRKIVQYGEPTNVGTAKVPTPLVHQACDNIDSEISFLKETIGELLNRLMPVLRDCAPNDVAKAGAAITASTPLSDRLEGYAQRILSIRCDVRNVLDRLEI